MPPKTNAQVEVKSSNEPHLHSRFLKLLKVLPFLSNQILQTNNLYSRKEDLDR